MNAKRTALILIALALALAACEQVPEGIPLWNAIAATETPSLKPAIPTTPATPVPSAMPSGGAELTVLASGSGVTILEYQGAGVRCIIASDGAGVDMVCQTAPTTPAQPTPTEQPKHQVPNGSSEA